MITIGDVKWIKITTDIFDDEKILLIESLPDANAIIVVWFKILCLAGKQNNGGVFVMNDKIAYTDKMLATIFRMNESTVSLALETFERFGMIERIDGVITIPNWGKHQSLEKIEARKEYQREYQKELRQRQKVAIEQGKTERKCLRKHLRKQNVNSLEEEGEEELEIEGDKKEIYSGSVEPTHASKPKPSKKTFGEYRHVRLTDAEVERLHNDYGIEKTDAAIKYLDEYIEMKGTKYTSHNLVLRKWVFSAVDERQRKGGDYNGTGGVSEPVKEETESDKLRRLYSQPTAGEWTGF